MKRSTFNKHDSKVLRAWERAGTGRLLIGNRATQPNRHGTRSTQMTLYNNRFCSPRWRIDRQYPGGFIHHSEIDSWFFSFPYPVLHSSNCKREKKSSSYSTMFPKIGNMKIAMK